MKKLQVRTAHPLNILTSILKPAGSREAFARANHLLFACLAFFEFSITFLLEDLKTVKQMDSQSTTNQGGDANIQTSVFQHVGIITFLLLIANLGSSASS